jgi:hypothetical protein
MGSLVSKFFSAFEGKRSALPVAVFRVAFFGGVALHFFPSLVVLDEGYRRGALRTEEWNHWLYVHFTQFQPGTLRMMSVITMIAIACGIVGLRPRIAAIVGGLGIYAFASFNGLHVHTLALLNTWAFFLLFALCGGGSATLSIDAMLAKGDAKEAGNAAPKEDKLLASLILYQTLLSVFFSGVEKLLAGWPFVNEMGILLSYPKGFLVRDWVAARDWMHGSGLTRFYTWATVFVEMGTPIALLFKRTRIVALVLYELFFLGIIAMLEVPPLFWFMFAFGALLALDDEEVDRIVARFRRRTSATSASPEEAKPTPE